MVPDHIAIIGGDHSPAFPFVIVDRLGMHVDIDNIDGQLWDGPTVASVHWGLRSPSGARFGEVRLKNGDKRTFWDGELMLPYVKAWTLAKAAHDVANAAAKAEADRLAAEAVVTAAAPLTSLTESDVLIAGMSNDFGRMADA